MSEQRSQPFSRRAFVQTTAAMTAGLVLPRSVGAAARSPDVLRVGLIGCGGRGTGAARDCLRASDGVELLALGDLFPDRLQSCRANLAKLASEEPAVGAKYKVKD